MKIVSLTPSYTVGLEAPNRPVERSSESLRGECSSSAIFSYVHSVHATSARDKAYFIETSAGMFEKQVPNLCNLMGETHNYDFADGPVVCGPEKSM